MSTTMPHYVAGSTYTGKTTNQITPRAMDVPSTSTSGGGQSSSSGLSPYDRAEDSQYSSEQQQRHQTYRERGELMPHTAQGVWIATNVWKKMRRELATRENQVEDLKQEHKEEMLRLIESTNHINIRNREITDQLARVENIHLQKQKQLEDQIHDLHSRLDSAIRSSEKQKFEHEAEIDYLTRLLSERHEADEQVKILKQKLDDAELKVKLEKHRCTVSVNRNKVLEKEIEFFKDQHTKSKKKMNELEERNRESIRQMTAIKQEIQKYKDKVKLAARPNEILKREKDRYKGDCQRLMYLLEQSEHKRFAKELQKVNAMHYVSLADCLYVDGVTSEKYTSNADRPALAQMERSNWVPAKALNLAMDFVKEHDMLNLPLQPFTVLLLQLNKVWKMKEKSKLKAKSMEIEKKYSKLKRMTENSKPYKLVMCKEKVKHLKRQLSNTKQRNNTLERMKQSFKHANDENTKLLVQCGVGTIKQLDSQLKGAKNKNRKLSRKLSKISTIAKQKADEDKQSTKAMQELLEESRLDELLTMTSAGEEEDLVDDEGDDVRTTKTDDEQISVVYPETSQADVLQQALDRKEEKARKKTRCRKASR